MSTLLLRLAGPMQSWGTASRFQVRDTGLEPSKSGVVGLVCAALGRPRNRSVDDIAALRMGVRVDRPGVVSVDYQTAGGGSWKGVSYGVAKASGNKGEPVQSWRQYLADADFLVGLEGPGPLLGEIEAALKSPAWPLYLGRKGYVPALPVYVPDGLVSDSLERALATHLWRAAPGRRPSAPPQQLLLVLESDAGASDEVRRDQPVGAAYASRSFALRHVYARFVAVPKPPEA